MNLSVPHDPLNTGPRTEMSKNQTSGTASATHCGYWAWKIFQAGLLCAGDFSDLEEMLADGCGELDAGEISSVAVEACQLAKHTADVGKFTHKFATQLTTHKSGAAPAKRMEQAHNLYESFVAADTNRDGRISRTEYIRFAAKLGETREDSSAIFTLLDKDRDGEMRPPYKQ